MHPYAISVVVPVRRVHIQHPFHLLSPPRRRLLHLHPLPLHLNPPRLRPIILDQLIKPRMLQRLPRRNPLLRIINKNLPQKIQKLLIELVRRRDSFVQPLHAADEFSRLSRRVREGIGEVAVFEEAGGGVAVAAFGDALDFADEGFVDWIGCDGL